MRSRCGCWPAVRSKRPHRVPEQSAHSECPRFRGVGAFPVSLDFSFCRSHHCCMFWHLLLILLSPLSTLCLRLVRDHRDREILALRQQMLILQRHLAKRPRFSRSERLAVLLTFGG